MSKSLFLVLSFIVILAGCQQSGNMNPGGSAAITSPNPAAQGFNADSSDAKAITIADSVMQAMGGRKNWDDTNIIHWTFFGRRTHTWDKQHGKDRIEIPSQNMVINENINSHEGSVMKNGEKMTQPDSVKKYLQKGYEWWVNDSYWLVMPYKLKDSGVTLKYMGMDSTQTGEPAYKLQLTFDSVGVTPHNKFWVYVDTTDNMVRQWAYFPKAEMTKPAFVLPWKDYEKHGGIMLSGNRGKYKLTDIKVMDKMPDMQ